MKPNIMKTMTTILFVAILLAGLLPNGARGAEVTPAEARAIAKEAYIYGFPIDTCHRL